MQIKENVSVLQMTYQGIYIVVLIVLAIMLFACLIRAIRGPRIADRIVAVNMMGTMVMVMIAVLSLLLEEGYLIDICLIYAMVSFLAVIVISKVYMGVYEEKQHKQHKKNGEQQAVKQEGEVTNGNHGMD